MAIPFFTLRSIHAKVEAYLLAPTLSLSLWIEDSRVFKIGLRFCLGHLKSKLHWCWGFCLGPLSDVTISHRFGHQSFESIGLSILASLWRIVAFCHKIGCFGWSSIVWFRKFAHRFNFNYNNVSLLYGARLSAHLTKAQLCMVCGY